MNLDIEALRAVIGDLVLQNIALSAQVKALQADAQKQPADANAKQADKPAA